MTSVSELYDGDDDYDDDYDYVDDDDDDDGEIENNMQYTAVTAPVLLKEEDGGYDYEFIQPGPSEDCICTICHLVARNAQQSSCCGKIFCEVCINKVKKPNLNVNCPNCRQNLQYFKDIRTNREIQSLKIYCTNHSKGCLWKDELNKVEEHIKICPYQIIECEKKCDQKIQRQLMQAHLKNDCPNRDVMCIHCQEIGTWVFINGDHFDECPDFLLPCPNTGCEKQVKRRNLKSHHETCLKRVISCPFVKVGCTLTFKNEDIVKHKQEHIEKHLSLATVKLENVEKDLSLATKKLQDVEKDLSLALEKIENFEIQQQDVERDLSLALEKIENFEIQQQTAPLVLKIETFDGSTPVRSQPFYTSKGGYKMSLLVKPNGFQEHEKKWVSCSIDVMPGEYDDTLEWPFRGQITVELLNQLQNNNHRHHTVNYPETPGLVSFRQVHVEACKSKKKSDRKYGKIGEISQLISHNDLGLGGIRSTQNKPVPDLGGIRSTQNKPVPDLGGIRLTQNKPVPDLEGIRLTQNKPVPDLGGIRSTQNNPVPTSFTQPTLNRFFHGQTNIYNNQHHNPFGALQYNMVVPFDNVQFLVNGTLYLRVNVRTQSQTKPWLY